MWSLRTKQLTLNNLMHQRSETIIFVADLGNDGVNFRPVGGLRSGSGGVGQQLRSQGPAKLVFVFQQQLLEVVNVLKAAAVGQDVGGIDLLAFVVGHSAAVHDHRFTVASDAVAVAPAANAI